MVPEYPWEVLTIDLMGPYPKGTNQNQYLFVIVDSFTKFVEMFPLRKATSGAVIQKLWTLCCRWGFPKVLISDNGTQFTSKEYTGRCKTFGIVPFHISPYHAQANMTERYNKIIKKMIIASLDRIKDWDRHIDELSFALRTCVSDATSVTPSYLFTGREFRTPFDNLLQIDLPSNKTSSDLLSRMCLTYNIVRDSILSSQEIYLKHYNAKTKLRSLSVGDLVTVRTHHLSDSASGFSSKLGTKRLGPFKVVEVVSPNVYSLIHVESGQLYKKCHSNDINPFHSRKDASARAPNPIP